MAIAIRILLPLSLLCEAENQSIFSLEIQNHRMVEVGREYWKSSCPSLLSSMVIYSQLCRTVSRHLLSISDDGGFTTLLGSFNSNLESCSSTDPCLHPSGYIKTEKPSIYNMLYSRKAMFLGRCTLANFLRSPPHLHPHLHFISLSCIQIIAFIWLELQKLCAVIYRDPLKMNVYILKILLSSYRILNI